MKTNKKGIILVELLIYMVMAVVLLAVTGYFIVSAYYVYGDTTARSQADRIATTILNQLVRETREGISIDTAQSAFSTPTGFVTITTSTVNKEFSLSGGTLFLEEGLAAPLPLNPDTHDISRFYLTQITTPVSSGIRYEIGVTYDVRDGQETRYYTGFSILRQSYE